MKHSTPLGAGRPRRDRSGETFWREALRRFALSGQSIRAFCRSRGLSEPSFYAWRRALTQRDERSAAAAQPSDAPAFVPVRIADQTGQQIEIILRGGRRIRLSAPVDKAALAEMVAALEAVPVAAESVQ